MKRLHDWYRHPRYYEAVFGTDTGREADFLEGVNELYGTGGDVWLEPACGAGRLVEAAVRRGYTVVGYDLSEEMLAYARRRLPPRLRGRAHLFPGRMETFHARAWEGEVDLAFSLVSTFRYIDSEEGALAHLRRTRQFLKPRGVYVLGFHLTDYRRTKPEHERWVGKTDGERVICNTREWPPDRRRRRARMRNRLRIDGAQGHKVIETDWFFRTYDERQAEDLLAKAGFELRAVYGFDADLAQPLSWDSDRLDRILVLTKRR